MEPTSTGMEQYMLACPIKSMTGVDCPGCGFQRGLFSLAKGDVGQAWAHYPPIFPFVLTFALLLVALLSKSPWRLRLLVGSFVLTLVAVAAHYAYKMLLPHA